MSALTASAIEEAMAKKKEEAPPRSPFTVKYEGDDQEPADIPPADAEDLIASATSMVKPASVEAQVAAAINAAEAGPVESVTFSDGGGASSFIPLGVVIRFATSNRPTHRALVVDMRTLYCNLGALRAVRYDVDRYNQSLDYEAMVFGGGGDGEEEDERTATLLSFRFQQQCRTWGFRQPEHMPAVIPGLDALIALIETAHADAIGSARELIAGGGADFDALAELHQPGTEVVDTTGLLTGFFGSPAAFLVRSCKYTEGKSSLGKLERSFSITLEFVVSVGTRFMVVETTVSSGEGVYAPFKGERPDTQAQVPLVIAEES